MGKRICLLGFSGSIISLIFNTLNDLEYTEEVMIIENLKIIDDIPFDCSIPYYKVWHSDYEMTSQDTLSFAVMTPEIKRRVFDFFQRRYGLGRVNKERFVNIIHPSATIASSARFEQGLYVDPGAIVAPYVRMGFGVSLNRGATIGHHTQLGDLVTVYPGAHIAGHCNIGNDTSIGIGACVFDHITIGKNSIIGGGSVVNKNIPDNVLAYGNPCKVVREI